MCSNGTHPVESYSPNGYGLYDMAGNVEEWVNDWHFDTYYQYCVDNGIVNDPPGPGSGEYRVRHGGSHWSSNATEVRVADRQAAVPDSTYWDIGFRCARGGAYGP
jgi:formylglycine-generating enzyme required for sulfatase activity